MRKVFKYPVPLRSAKFTLQLPRTFKFIRVGYQADQLFMWLEVVEDSPKIKIDFQVFGTGHDIPDGPVHLTTYDNGPFVLHLYQVTDTKAPYV